ncbi:Protein ECM11 [Nakaseomyces bracarensis]|uniref:Protein ECM11 n=1 Tax=Nakaseomyces bracarensis TaxID=273131 RepID=A0ABR4NY91_9SACH
MSIVKTENGKKIVKSKKHKELKLENFLLSPGKVTSSTPTTPSIKHENNIPMPSSDLKNKWHLTGKLFDNTEEQNKDDITQKISTLNDTMSNEGRDTVNNIDKSGNNTHDQSQVQFNSIVAETPKATSFQPIHEQEEVIINPGPYVRHTKLLYEDTDDGIVLGKEEVEEIFPGLNKEEEKKYCNEATNWSLEEWVKEGELLLNAQQEIFATIIQKRIELSCNFAALLSVLDDRAEALCLKGDLIEKKLGKVKELGNEILNLL